MFELGGDHGVVFVDDDDGDDDDVGGGSGGVCGGGGGVRGGGGVCACVRVHVRVCQPDRTSMGIWDTA